MKGPVSESKMGGILVHAKLAAKNVRAQRDRLLQFQLQLLAPAAGAALLLKEVASGLIDVSFSRIELGARSLATSIKLAVINGVPPSLPLDFGVMPDEQLFDRLVALRLPRRPVSQDQAFAQVEAAYYAVKCNQEHFLPRCVEHLGYPYPVNATSDDDAASYQDSLPGTDDKDSQDGSEIGLPDPVAAAAENLAKIGLSDPDAATTEEDLVKICLSDPDAAATEPTEDSSKTGLPAPAASVTGETLQAASIDLDQARTYLDRACTLANLAVKRIDLAVTAISRFADPKEIASISRFVDQLDGFT